MMLKDRSSGTSGTPIVPTDFDIVRYLGIPYTLCLRPTTEYPQHLCPPTLTIKPPSPSNHTERAECLSYSCFNRRVVLAILQPTMNLQKFRKIEKKTKTKFFTWNLIPNPRSQNYVMCTPTPFYHIWLPWNNLILGTHITPTYLLNFFRKLNKII